MNILIVDDEKLVREGIEKRIRKYGYPVKCIFQAAYARQAMEILEQNPVNLVFVDINMPFMNGLDFVEKYQDSGIIFVIVSGYDNFSYAQRAICLNVFRYILKPIQQKEFQEVMDEVLKQLQHTQERHEYGSLAGEIMSCIRDNLADTGFSLGSCAAILQISESSISKTLKKNVGTGFTDLLNHQRIEYAARLIEQSDGKIRSSSLAGQCGFVSQQYFSVVFKKIMGMTPSQYKENVAEK